MQTLFSEGRLETGCNYWASHAGTAMWHTWDAAVIEADLQTVASMGMTVIRVFPLWPDFQPLIYIRGGKGARTGIGIGDNLLTPEEFRRGGTDPVMLERFRFLADTAAKNGLRLIVSLITGWMSGRYFAPPAFAERNPLTDPETIVWEVRFVRHFVRTFREHPAIAAWELGNECNCMGDSDRSASWCWTHAIVSAIRGEDPERPVISGMHSLRAEKNAAWQITDQGELLDVLTTHPYPLFTPYCSKSPFNTYPGTYHAAAESVLYHDLSGKPCFVEETGNLGPMYASNDRSAQQVRTMLASAWTHGLGACLWWCGFDQTCLNHMPYDAVAMERELGLFRTDRSAKPVVLAMREFQKQLKQLPFDRLPPRTIHAVCLLGDDEDSWKTAFGAFQIAVQSGMELRFALCTQEIPEANFYILPSMNSYRCVPGHVWHELLERVRRGAALLMTEDTGMVEPFERVFHAAVDYRYHEPRLIEAVLPDGGRFRCHSPITQKLLANDAEVMLHEEDGSPLLIRQDCGAGQLFFLNAPIEKAMTENGGDFTPVYRMVQDCIAQKRVFCSKDCSIGITEHRFDNGDTAIVLVNYGEVPAKAVFDGEVGELFFGTRQGREITVGGNAMAVLLRRK